MLLEDKGVSGLIAAFVFAVTAMTTSSGVAHAMPAYGYDDRLDLYEVREPLPGELALSVVSIFKDSEVEFNSDGKQARLRTKPHSQLDGRGRDLCPGERFREQREGSHCTGVLVAPDIIATAGHCVQDAVDCRYRRFVFGFALNGKKDRADVVDAADVYGCGELIQSHSHYEDKDPYGISYHRNEVTDDNHDGTDFALIRLDRPVLGRKPVLLNRDDVSEGTPLLMIGNPDGLPLKVAGNARVRQLFQNYFVANLDAFHGNSGSPVFNAGTGLLEGLLSRGKERDYGLVKRWWMGKECYSTQVLPDDGGAGVVVTKVSTFAALVP